MKTFLKKEIAEVIKGLPNNKSPGTNGLTYEFYKHYEEVVTPILQKVFNDILSTGNMPISWTKSLIVLIPKKSSDLNNINNWRPISLVNCDAKIFMKILANRLNEICKDLVPNHQQGFIKSRAITDTALDILTVMRNQQDNTKQNWLLLVDQQKAFDRVNHNYLSEVLRKMNFNSTFRRLIRTLFTNQEAHIIAAGKISAPFRVERGVRQGDPLSPLLYILAFDPLLQKLNRELLGIQLENSAFKAAAYADDLTLGIGSRADWDIIKRNFALYEGASNAKINQNKSKLIPLTNAARSLELDRK